MKKRKSILFFGELPPLTVHGASISNEINLKMLDENFNIKKVIETYNIKNHSSGYVAKASFFLKSILIFIKENCLDQFHIYYGVIYLSPLGILKNYLLVAIFKLTNPRGKVILHFHRSDFNQFVENKFNSLIFYCLDFLTDRYILLSDSQINDFSNNKNKCFVLYNTIQSEVSFFNKDETFINDSIKLIYLGNYIKEKGIVELVKAVIEANKKFNSRFELNMYGVFASENLKKEVFLLTKNIDFVTINGPLHGNDKFLKIYESDLLILPSYNEGLPLVLLESMSVGVPVIITKVGYIKDALGDDYPLYCEAQSVNSILDSLNKYLNIYQKFKLNELIIDKYKKYSRESHRIKLLNIFSFEN
jgi:glycosyltransferase involved in cell wall biosynthesis